MMIFLIENSFANDLTCAKDEFVVRNLVKDRSRNGMCFREPNFHQELIQKWFLLGGPWESSGHREGHQNEHLRIRILTPAHWDPKRCPEDLRRALRGPQDVPLGSLRGFKVACDMVCDGPLANLFIKQIGILM